MTYLLGENRSLWRTDFRQGGKRGALERSNTGKKQGGRVGLAEGNGNQGGGRVGHNEPKSWGKR